MLAYFFFSTTVVVVAMVVLFVSIPSCCRILTSSLGFDVRHVHTSASRGGAISDAAAAVIYKVGSIKHVFTKMKQLVLLYCRRPARNRSIYTCIVAIVVPKSTNQTSVWLASVQFRASAQLVAACIEELIWNYTILRLSHHRPCMAYTWRPLNFARWPQRMIFTVTRITVL